MIEATSHCLIRRQLAFEGHREEKEKEEEEEEEGEEDEEKEEGSGE
jgi:hypothetical protein